MGKVVNMEENNFNISIYVESRYRINRKKIKQAVVAVLTEKGIRGSCEVSIAIVGNRKMKKLNREYRNIDKTTDVLAFSQIEGQNLSMPDNLLVLGDVVVCYPKAVVEAAEAQVLVDDKICELVDHGVRHLCQEDHD